MKRHEGQGRLKPIGQAPRSAFQEQIQRAPPTAAFAFPGKICEGQPIGLNLVVSRAMARNMGKPSRRKSSTAAGRPPELI
jgi:hypothetical protein